MKATLKELASVQMGYSFRSRLENTSEGNIGVIQMKDLEDDNTVSCRDLVKIRMEEIKNHHLVRTGDLVFRSRGQVPTSAILLVNSGETVIAAPLLRIRVKKPQTLLPEYLNWFIRQNETQAFLKSRQAGTHGGMISKQTLEDMEIILPDIARQQLIVELAQLAFREKELLRLLSEKKERHLSFILMKYAKGTTENDEGLGKGVIQ